MRRMLAVAAMVLTVAGVAGAQGGGGGGMRMGGMQMSPETQDSLQFARLFDGITLNADQTAKAKAIITAARVARAGIDRQATDAREQLTAVATKQNADLKALLTSDADKTKFDENAARGRGRRGGGH